MKEPARPKSVRKDMKRWCRGKVGVEHVPMIVIMTTWHGRDECHLSFEGWPLKRWRGRWWCYHFEECENCGKVLRYRLGKADCPTFIARWDAE